MLIFSHVKRVLFLQDVFSHVGGLDYFVITPITAILNILKAGVDILGPYAFARAISVVADDEQYYEIYGIRLSAKNLLYITAACYAYSRFAPHFVRSTVVGTRKRMVRNMVRSILDKTSSLSYSNLMENRNLLEQSVQYAGEVSELVSIIPSNIHQSLLVFIAGTTIVFLGTGNQMGSVFLSFVILNLLIGFGLYELFGAAKVYRLGNKKFLEFATRYKEDLVNFDVIRVFNKEKLEIAIVDNLNESYLTPYEQGVWKESASSVFTNFLPMVADFGVIIYMIESGNLSLALGELVFLLGLLGTINFNNGRFIDSCYRSFRLTTNYDEIKKVLNLPSDDHSLEQADDSWLLEVLKQGPTIKFENISYKYNPQDEKYALHNINFEIPSNEHWAIIGNSGSGKSTIAKLLLRLYKPTLGVIKINGKDLNTIPEKDLHKVIGLLSQEVHLFENDTIEFNVAYGLNGKENFLMTMKKDPDNYCLENKQQTNINSLINSVSQDNEYSVHDEKSEQQLLLSDVCTFESIETGYPNSKPEEKDLMLSIQKALNSSSIQNERKNEKIPTKAKELSTGQKQRVGLARLLLQNSSIFVLDEPTAAIDSEIEAKVTRAINRNSVNKTTVMIAHRLNTVVNSNKIIVVNKGKIDQIGTHEELLQSCKKYNKLWKIQQGIDAEQPSAKQPSDSIDRKNTLLKMSNT